jgi:glutaredoxin
MASNMPMSHKAMFPNVFMGPMGKAKLFVRSIKVNTPGADHIPGDYYRSLPAPTTVSKTEIIASQQDKEAKQVMKRSGIPFELVDLSKGRRAMLMARFQGVKETPALRIENESAKLYVGVNAITNYLRDNQLPRQSLP